MLKYRLGLCWSEAGLGHVHIRLGEADVVFWTVEKEESVWIGQESERCRETNRLPFAQVLQLSGKGARQESRGLVQLYFYECLS